jgi:FkbM family methyltransferase
VKLLRRIVIPLLKFAAFDLSIKHHWVPSKRFRLNSFRHKGYWYSGSRREERSMRLFARIIQPGMTVAEVGGHIGYISIYFADLVGSKGKVVVFEPGTNNLPYTRANLAKIQHVVLEEKGVAQKDGTLTFLEESLTGQNNTFSQDFQGVEVNKKSAYVDVQVRHRDVQVVALDSYFRESTPDFIKIDVEGFEYEVLLGGLRLMERKPMWMVEVQSNRSEIYKILSDYGYILFNEVQQRLETADGLQYNTFCLHREKHRSLLDMLNIAIT